MEVELRGHIEELADADRKKDEFLAVLGHELRNPLAPILNAVAILRAKGPPVPDLVWAREVIHRQTEYMARMLDDLLDVSRIGRNSLQLRKQRVTVAAVVQRALETSRPLIDAAGHRFTLELPSIPMWLDADPLRLTQAIANILNNAAKYTDQGGDISLLITREGSDAVLSVRDTGIGISVENLPRVFEIFAQAVPALERSRGGLGIGLSLVRSIIQMLGGHIEARSHGAGQGSEFVVRLPIATGPGSAPREDDPIEELSTTTPGRLRVVVGDDNADALESLGMMLGIVGYEVHLAHDGLEAVEVAQAVLPDVILLDIGMPRLNGYEAARRIRAEPWGKNIVLVALTGWGQSEDRMRAAEAGFDHHCVKPVEFSVLRNLLPLVGSTRQEEPIDPLA
ncbi:MAG: response regulator [Candidatus Eisenbacteria bacterium]|uniref:histidine kinase n=1 Tax=Eiseniibacteriota bacterium TaxID=2212470 RepID=A0A538U659_UNCEI|nr:MAG: response regulator [Candidatus Eisenbacteria bacterium]